MDAVHSTGSSPETLYLQIFKEINTSNVANSILTTKWAASLLKVWESVKYQTEA